MRAFRQIDGHNIDDEQATAGVMLCVLGRIFVLRLMSIQWFASYASAQILQTIGFMIVDRGVDTSLNGVSISEK